MKTINVVILRINPYNGDNDRKSNEVNGGFFE